MAVGMSAMSALFAHLVRDNGKSAHAQLKLQGENDKYLHVDEIVFCQENSDVAAGALNLIQICQTSMSLQLHHNTKAQHEMLKLMHSMPDCKLGQAL